MKKRVFATLLLGVLLTTICMGCGKDDHIKPFEEKHPKQEVSTEIEETSDASDMVEDFFEIENYQYKVGVR